MGHLEIYSSFDAFLGAILRDLVVAHETGPPLRLLALLQTAGQQAIDHALRYHVADRPASQRHAATVAWMLLTEAGGALNPATGGASLMLGMAAGMAYLLAARQLTPHRHTLAAAIAPARARWNALHRSWLDGTLRRPDYEQAIDALRTALRQALAS